MILEPVMAIGPTENTLSGILKISSSNLFSSYSCTKSQHSFTSRTFLRLITNHLTIEKTRHMTFATITMVQDRNSPSGIHLRSILSIPHPHRYHRNHSPPHAHDQDRPSNPRQE